MVDLLRVAQQDDFRTHPGAGDDPLGLLGRQILRLVNDQIGFGNRRPRMKLRAWASTMPRSNSSSTFPERLRSSVIKKVFMLNTIELPPEKQCDLIEQISVAPIFSKAIESVFADMPISRLYED